MQTLFQYNWQVRADWFDWCAQISEEELWRDRVGGVGSILKTLIHVIDVEYSWLKFMDGDASVEKIEYPVTEYNTLAKVRQLSDRFRPFVAAYVDAWSPQQETEVIYVPWWQEHFTKGAILRHVIAHEIHHMGQLSVWSRDLDRKPVSANLIGRGLLPVSPKRD